MKTDENHKGVSTDSVRRGGARGGREKIFREEKGIQN